MSRPVALTGTPGTGKSRVAAALSARYRVVEVADLARAWGVARPLGRGVEVDLERLISAFRRRAGRLPYELVVGHLAHLLPVRDVVVLRCHPEKLARRLRAARRGSAEDRRANYVAEALDLVLAEAVRPRRTVWEVDTSGRSVAHVARAVAERVRQRGPSDYGRVDWLADPRVTAHLLDRSP